AFTSNRNQKGAFSLVTCSSEASPLALSLSLSPPIPKNPSIPAIAGSCGTGAPSGRSSRRPSLLRWPRSTRERLLLRFRARRPRRFPPAVVGGAVLGSGALPC
uniref:Uncharacterized protein n=1 Tax=Aegilops tauschii subsp. strangulata TaxID=200361 RepID=A0A452Y1A5_AEGTS